MKVILTADVKGHGKKGDMVNASDGYARNYLLPKGLAIVADKSAVNVMESKKSAQAYHKNQEKLRAMELADKLKEAAVEFSAKAGENGKLFGSITAKDVAEQLKMQCHLVVDKKKIHLPDGIKTLGDTKVLIKVYPEITAEITVRVTAQN
ncbi:MAG: 50S ribosomal protein L9 [Ruminococcaceae bacterium]|nr:50S ribosomal protein L9 [Oscillospiraceae bacterium]